MKKFLVIYKASPEEFAKAIQMTPEDQKESMQEWMAWMERHKANLADTGAPVGKTKEVTASGVTDIKNDIGGYNIVQAESADAAAQVVADSPHLKRMKGSIEVMEILAM